MSQENFDGFVRLVLDDTSLQDQLKDIDDQRLFTEMVVKLGNERGYQFTIQEVKSAINANRKSWFERWITR